MDDIAAAVAAVKANPQLLHDPKYAALKDLLMAMNATVPEAKAEPKPAEPAKAEPAKAAEKKPAEAAKPAAAAAAASEVIEGVDASCVVPADSGEALPFGDPSAEVSEENEERAQKLYGEAMDANSDGRLEDAIKLLNESLAANPSNKKVLAQRARTLLQQKKPKSAMCDAQRLLDQNPDSSQGLKLKGRAHMLLGEWTEANKFLSQANSIDFQDDVAQWLKVVKVNAQKVAEHQRKKQQQQEEAKKAPSASASASSTSASSSSKAKTTTTSSSTSANTGASASAGAGAGGFPGGFPNMAGMPGMPAGGVPPAVQQINMAGMPGMPAGGVPPAVQQILQDDPELLALLSDPEITPVISEIMANPIVIMKYMNHPKIGKFLTKVMGKMGSMGAAMGGMPGMGGAGAGTGAGAGAGAGAAAGGASKPAASSAPDVDLD